MELPRVLSSSKYQGAMAATLIAGLPMLYVITDHGASRDEKYAAMKTFVVAACGAWGISIGGTALEDYAKYRDGPATGQPVLNVQTGPAAQNTQGPPVATPVGIVGQNIAPAPPRPLLRPSEVPPVVRPSLRSKT